MDLFLILKVNIYNCDEIIVIICNTMTDIYKKIYLNRNIFPSLEKNRFYRLCGKVNKVPFNSI